MRWYGLALLGALLLSLASDNLFAQGLGNGLGIDDRRAAGVGSGAPVVGFYVLLNAGGHITLNAGGSLLCNNC